MISINKGVISTIAAAGIVLAALASAGVPGARIEDPLQRAAALIGGSRSAAVSMIEIDGPSILSRGEWPWPPAEISRILDQLSLANAALAVLDSSVTSVLDERALRKHLTREGRPWLAAGYRLHPKLSDLPDGYESASARIEGAMASRALPASPADDSSIRAVAGADAVSVEASRTAPASGFTNLFPDADGVVRRMTAAARLGEDLYPSLPLSAAAAFHGFTPLLSESPAGRTDGVAIGKMRMRTSPDASMPIDFSRCPPVRERATASGLLENQVPAELINRKIVIIGVVEPGTAPFYSTPAGKMSEAELMACAVSQTTAGADFRSFTGRPFAALAAALAAAACIAATAVRRRSAGTALVLFLAAAASAASLFACVKYGILLPAAHFSAALIVLFALSMAWRTLAVDIPARRRSAALRGRLSQRRIRTAFETSGALNAEGRSCEVAALALDLRGFGSISRTLDAAMLCSFVRSYRDMVAGHLLDHGAIVDSWAADECRAAFGSPLPIDDRAMAACRSAVKILHAASAAREGMRARYGVDRLRLAVGLWLGRAAQGQLGPAGADNFGVVGDAMEAAAALRSLARVYGTSIIVNDDMTKAAEKSFRFRPLDPVLLQGAGRPATIHELVGETGVIMPQLPQYLAARSAYLKGDFERAEALFAELLSEHPHDGPSRLFLKRTKTLLKSPPKAEWLGVWQP